MTEIMVRDLIIRVSDLEGITKNLKNEIDSLKANTDLYDLIICKKLTKKIYFFSS